MQTGETVQNKAMKVAANKGDVGKRLIVVEAPEALGRAEKQGIEEDIKGKYAKSGRGDVAVAILDSGTKMREILPSGGTHADQ